MTNIEKIKAFLSIKNFLRLKDQEYLIEKLELSEIDLTKRLKGKETEIDYITYARCMQSYFSI